MMDNDQDNMYKILYHNDNCIVCMPALTSSNTTYRLMTIGKIVSQYDIHNELSAADFIQLIDPNHRFTPRITIKRVPSNVNINFPCKLLKRPKQNKYYEVEMDYCGIDTQRIMNMGLISVESWNNLLDSMVDIFRGVSRINNEGYLHLDIKPPNMTFFHNKCFLIDFGLFTKFNEINCMRPHIYVFHPVERYLIDFINAGNFSELVDYYSKLYINDDFVRILFSQTKQNFGFDIYSKYYTEIRNMKMNSFLSKYMILHRIDTYGLAMTLLMFANHLMKLDREMARALFDFLIKSKILCFDPYRRLSTTQAYRAFKEFRYPSKFNLFKLF